MEIILNYKARTQRKSLKLSLMLSYCPLSAGKRHYTIMSLHGFSFFFQKFTCFAKFKLPVVI